MEGFAADDAVRELIRLARAEDLGGDDVTSRLLVGADALGVGTVVQRQAGVACGLPLVGLVAAAYDPRLVVEPAGDRPVAAGEGRYSAGGGVPLVRVRGPLRSLLSAERVILNFLQHLSGVATLTRQFVELVAGTRARIYDTRKTLPGYRRLEKYAVRCGGGHNHRLGLYDGLLVKDNHLRRVPAGELATWLTKVVQASRAEAADRLVEVEVESLAQLGAVLEVAGVDVVLLDNMDVDLMRRAVQLRDAAGAGRAGAKPDLEASGGVTRQTVRAVAETGVDRIAIGALTHSAPALDIALDVA